MELGLSVGVRSQSKYSLEVKSSNGVEFEQVPPKILGSNCGLSRINQAMLQSQAIGSTFFNSLIYNNIQSGSFFNAYCCTVQHVRFRQSYPLALIEIQPNQNALDYLLLIAPQLIQIDL